ncbi:MAG: L-ribulose-5-phosphate 4-epimerase [Ktedonobacterales bacterium]|jgi:L-fuculose-phosphate aldolase|nr:MAG: L-ribulose-5-phosphate 4-epimerase [Ktedonobacterales bacterium]
MRLATLRAEVARYAKKMSASGLVRATQGNLSARDPESGLICVTPSGADYDLLSAEDIVVVDAEGAVVEGQWKPSLETPLHTLLLGRRADIHCVMHTHSLYASAFAVLYQPVPMILAESAACLGGPVPTMPYQESGTLEFAERAAEALGQGHALLWGNHGAMVVGPSLALTYSIAHALEDTARIYAIAAQLGMPTELPPDEVARLHAWWKASYGQRVN